MVVMFVTVVAIMQKKLQFPYRSLFGVVQGLYVRQLSATQSLRSGSQAKHSIVSQKFNSCVLTFYESIAQ